MKQWETFSTFKQRGEWVELEFMAAAASRRYHVLKPWGDSLAYDVGIEQNGGLLRVQVKSSTVRNGTGYFCQFTATISARIPTPSMTSTSSPPTSSPSPLGT
jgi:PD-(D/E)XK nuclease superfamily protein